MSDKPSDDFGDFEVLSNIPPKRIQADPLPPLPDPLPPLPDPHHLIPDSYQVGDEIQQLDDVYIRMDSIVTTAYPDEVAPPSRAQMDGRDSGYEAYNRPSHNSNPSTPAKYSRDAPSQDGLPQNDSEEYYYAQSQNQRGRFPSNSGKSPHHFLPPYPDNAPYRVEYGSQQFYAQSDQNIHFVRGQNTNNAHSREPYPSDAYTKTSNSDNPYSQNSNPTDPYGRRPYSNVREPNPPSNAYSTQLGPNNSYGTQSGQGNAYDKQQDPNTREPDTNAYSRPSDLPSAYGGHSDPSNDYRGHSDPSNDYRGHSGPPNDYRGHSGPPNDYRGHSDPPNDYRGHSDPSNDYRGHSGPPNDYRGHSDPPNDYRGHSGPPNDYRGHSDPPNDYRGHQDPPNDYRGLPGPPNDYRGYPDPNKAYGGLPDPNIPYGGLPDPNIPYGGLPDPNIPYGGYQTDGRMPDHITTYNRQPYPNDEFRGPNTPNNQHVRPLAPASAYSMQPEPGNVHGRPTELDNVHGRESNPNFYREQDPQYAQVRKHSTSRTPNRFILSSQNISSAQPTRFDVPYPNTNLPDPNPLSPPIGSDLPLPNNIRLPAPRYTPTTPSQGGYADRSSHYGGYNQPDNYPRLPPPQNAQFPGYRDKRYFEYQHSTQFRQSHFEDDRNEGGYNLPPPHMADPYYPGKNVSDLPAPHIVQSTTRDNYYNQGQQPAEPYPYNRPKVPPNPVNIYESIDNNPSFSPAENYYDPNEQSAPNQRDNRVLPQPKIPPADARKPKVGHGDMNRGLEVLHIAPQPPVRPPTPPPPPPPGWECLQCTYRNKPMRPGCEMCATARPDGYIIPPGYELDEDEMDKQKRAEQHEIQLKEKQLLEREMNYKAMIEAADQDLIEVDEEFECPICIIDVDVGDGVRLRECLHAFCRDCLSLHIIHAEEAEVKCPYQGETYQCQSVVTEREVKQLLSPDQFKHWQQMGLNQAEGTIGNAFHCKSADCAGWCVYEDDINFFNCPVCNVQNCLTCKAIHTGKNCKEYQEEIVHKAKNDDNARRTQKMLEDMIKEGEAMKCPKCDVIIQKKLGCDWIRCTVCKTEICWATKGHRWGPKGKGDTSGGCKCRADGRTPCCPECRNCH